MTAIYADDPGRQPDSEFVTGSLRSVVVGSRGRLLDARRTPVPVTAVIADRAEFEVRVDAFEDQFREAEAVLVGDPANRGF